MKDTYVVEKMDLLYLVIVATVVFSFPFFIRITYEKFFDRSAAVELASIDIKETSSSKDDEESLKSKDVDYQKKVFKFGKNIMVHSNNLLSFFDEKGQEVWKSEINSNLSSVEKWNDNLLIINKETGLVLLLNEKNEEIAKEMLNRKIERIDFSREKIFLQMADKNEILIFDESLSLSTRITEEKGEFISIKANYESSELLVNRLIMEDSKISTFIHLYKPDGRLSATCDLGEEIVFHMFVSNYIYIVSDETFRVFSKSAKLISEKDYSGTVEKAEKKDSNIYMILSSGNEISYKKELHIYDSDFKEIKKINIKENIKRLVLGENRIILASQNRLNVYDYNLKSMPSILAPIDIDDIDFITSNTFYLTGDKKLKVYRLK